ncbi:MAG: malonyl-CoA synthase [Rhodobacteraceae bacterium]|nr:malonyl-CoA synthase [Paracoccaceae bacterium]
MANLLFDALFGRHIGKDTPFLLLPDRGDITHNAFLQLAGRYAHALTELGLKPGDRVCVQIDKSPEALAVYAACVQAGLVFLPLNPGYTASEVSYFLQDSGAGLFLCPDANAAGLKPVTEAQLETLNADGSGSFADRAAKLPATFETVARAGNDLAALLYTSGTTGRSKGAMLTHENLLSNTQTLIEEWHFSSGDILIHALPIFHTHGLFVATNVTLLAGGAALFLAKFDLDAIIAAMPRATVLMGVPTFYTRLLSDPRFTRELTAQMRLFISGSAPLLTETHQDFEALTGHRILERYGMTETNMNTSNPYSGERRAGTVGHPLPGVELKITDPESGAALAQGEIGSIEVRGPNVFVGYWQMPEKTAQELRQDGFFITGDLGKIDADGYVHIIGRGKDMIISGGHNIYPKEVELVLDAQPGMLESAVIGVPDDDLGEAVVAVLVAKDRGGAGLDIAAIKVAIAPLMARYKQPRLYVVATALPRNTMGKVQKNLLRAEHKALMR